MWFFIHISGAINTTAANIEVKPFKPPPALSLKDFMNPNAGKTVIDTSNMFQQEQLTGNNILSYNPVFFSLNFCYSGNMAINIYTFVNLQ